MPTGNFNYLWYIHPALENTRKKWKSLIGFALFFGVYICFPSLLRQGYGGQAGGLPAFPNASSIYT